MRVVRKLTYDNTLYTECQAYSSIQLTWAHSLRLKLTVQPSESCSREEITLYEVGEILAVKWVAFEAKKEAFSKNENLNGISTPELWECVALPSGLSIRKPVVCESSFEPCEWWGNVCDALEIIVVMQ